MRQRISRDVIVFLLWDLPLRVVCIPSETLLGRTIFSFTSGYPLEIASMLGMGAVSSTSLTAGIPSDTVLVHAPAVLWVHMCVSSAVFRRPCLFPWCPSSPVACMILTFPFLFIRVPGALRGRNLIENFHLGQLTVLVFLTLSTYILYCGS